MKGKISVEHLIGTLYWAATDPSKWGEFLWEASSFLNVPKASLLTHDVHRNERQVFASFGDGLAEASKLYNDYYAKYDGWEAMLSSTPGQPCLGHEYWSEQEMVKSAFYQDLLKPSDVRYMAAVITKPQMGFFESMSLYRGHRGERFDQDSVAALDLLYPHLQSAFFARRKLLTLEKRVSDLETALNQLDCPLILLNRQLKAVFVNQSASSILDNGDCLLFRNGSLHTRSTIDSSRLQAILETAVSGGLGRSSEHAGAIRVARANKEPLQVLAIPVARRSFQPAIGAAALVFITDPESKPTLPADILRALYGLTQMESRLALLILKGISLNEAAELNNVTKETVRTQLRSIYQKTGTNRQSDLMGLLSKLTQMRLCR